MSTTGLLNTVEAAAYLGVSKTLISRYFSEGKFPNGYRVGSAIRIPLSDLEALKQRKEAS